jgi:hypothetical protein
MLEAQKESVVREFVNSPGEAHWFACYESAHAVPEFD